MGTVARTAVIAGTASATSNAVNQRAHANAGNQQQAAAAPTQAAAAHAAAAPAPVATPPAAGGLAAQLTELAQLRDSGILTAEEFDAAKAKLLSS